jgi:nicotinamide mononucleotide transporter
LNYISTIYQGIIETSFTEWLAVVFSVFYVILASKEKIYCWIFAFISSLLFLIICFKSNLYLESGLQLFYAGMAVYGWFVWKMKNEKSISKGTKKLNLFVIALGSVLTFVLGFIFDGFTSQAMPYLDAFTTVFSLFATYMIVNKFLENWIYFIVIDIASIFLYAERGLFLTSILFLAYTSIAILGFITWRKRYLEYRKF